MSSEDEKIEYKVVFCGNSAVGKTSLFKKITTGEFYEKNISTIGMDKRTIPLEIEVEEKGNSVKKQIDISLIDTAGQERFKAITKSYFKDSDGVLLIYDITKKESLEKLNGWIESICEALGNTQSSQYIIFLIGNKLDLIGVEGKVREIDVKDAQQKCEENNMIWGGECSAKNFTDSQLIDLLKQYVKKIYEKIGPKIVKKQIVKKIGPQKKKKKNKCFFL